MEIQNDERPFLLGNTPAASNISVDIISPVAAGDQTKKPLGPTKRTLPSRLCPLVKSSLGLQVLPQRVPTPDVSPEFIALLIGTAGLLFVA